MTLAINRVVHCSRDSLLFDPHNETVVPGNVGKVATKYFSSVSASFGMKALAALSFFSIAVGVAVLATSVVNPVMAVVGTLCLLFIIIEFLRQRKHLLFEWSLLHTFKDKRDYWNPITSHIVLGGMPFENHLPRLKHMGINSVINCLEPFEKNGKMVRPLTAERLQEHHIETFQLPLPDFMGVPADKINEGVDFLHDEILAGRKVYVHCKAGRGRSATIVMCYLLKHGLEGRQFESFEDAFAYLKKLRPQISLKRNKLQERAIRAWYTQYCTKKLGRPNMFG